MEFVWDESGVATVEWVVITGACVGLGIAATSVVAVGVQDTAGDIGDQSGNQIIYANFATRSQSFSGGSSGWEGSGADVVTGFGAILGPWAGTEGLEAMHNTFAVPDGTDEVVMSFDLLSMDSLDNSIQWGLNEGPVLYVDGQEIARATSQSGNLTWTYAEGVEGITIESQAISTGSNIGGVSSNPGWYDGINHVTITMDDPGDEVRMGFGVVANQPIHDESVGIDNFSITTAGLGQ